MLTSFEGMTLPIGRTRGMKIRFWGVRGSFAMSRARVPALRRQHDLGRAASPTRGERLLIDLGTGATELAKQLMGGEFGKGQGSLPILLTHTHLDHIQGLPFFTPFFIKGNEIRIWAPIRSAALSLEATLQNQLAPHYSPLNGLENLAAGVTIETFVPGGTLAVPGFDGAHRRGPARQHVDDRVPHHRRRQDRDVSLSDVEYPSARRAAAAGARARAGCGSR